MHRHDLVRVKAYVVRAEDARLLGDMPSMRKLYAELFALNSRLIGEHAKRASNHQVGRVCRQPASIRSNSTNDDSGSAVPATMRSLWRRDAAVSNQRAEGREQSQSCHRQ